MIEKPNTVLIKDFAFDPATITVAKGTTVTWMNMDSALHNVVSSGNDFSSETLKNGQSYAHTFNETGTFGYNCGFHKSMTGKVIVN
jgi:plastocyanin